MNRRSFLRFIGLAPIAAPVAAKNAFVAADPSLYWNPITLKSASGYWAGVYDFTFSSRLSAFDADAYTFNNSLTSLDRSINQVASFDKIVEKVIDKTADNILKAVDVVAPVEPPTPKDDQSVPA